MLWVALVGEHSALDRFLHRLVLESTSVSELLADLESGYFKNVAPRKDAVYVTGLARCGSTSLLRALHASRAFACLTYRDMPFVIAPNLWQHIVGHQGVTSVGRERAHGDGISEDRDSPEGLEEVFWRKELGDVYIRKDSLRVHEVPAASLQRLRLYQSLICARYRSTRYLAKNNNLMLRIRSLAPRTKDCYYLVLFRHPRAHAESLLRQHLRFSAPSGFARDYMRWLVHHEFGAGHRPFRFSGSTPSTLLPNMLDYWFERWIDAYSYLLDVVSDNPTNTLPVHYERLCEDEIYRAAVFARVGAGATDVILKNMNKNNDEGNVSGPLSRHAESVFSELCELASHRYTAIRDNSSSNQHRR